MERLNAMLSFAWKCLSALLLWSLMHPAYAADPELMGARVSKSGDTARVVFEFDKAFSYRISTLKNPDRIVLDFPETSLQTSLRQLPVADTVIQTIRYSQDKAQRLRIVFDLRQPVKLRSFVLKPEQDYGYRLVLELSNNSVPRTTKTPTAASTVIKQAPMDLGRDIIVVIDPGHGGKDPGATGPRHSHEKNVVLAISRYLQQDLNKIPGVKAMLTRSGDYYLPLRERISIARKDKGDFFIAIHADAYKDTSARGASVFALSERGATSEAARWLAEKENYSELGGIDLENKSRLLRSVLIDLSQTATISESLVIGNDVLDNLRKIAPLHSQRVEQAPFVVLKSPDIPSLLVETGFISNPYEERQLNSSRYQKQLANALTLGIRDYFLRHPPPHTLIAMEHKTRIHYVKAGDTLSTIAEKYHSSVEILKQFNRLASSRLSVGQAIRIPAPDIF